MSIPLADKKRILRAYRRDGYSVERLMWITGYTRAKVLVLLLPWR